MKYRRQNTPYYRFNTGRDRGFKDCIYNMFEHFRKSIPKVYKDVEQLFLAGLDKVTKKRTNVERCLFLGPNSHTQSNSIDNLHSETRPKTVQKKSRENKKESLYCETG